MIQVRRAWSCGAVGMLGAATNIAVAVPGVLTVSWFKKVYSWLKEDSTKTEYIHREVISRRLVQEKNKNEIMGVSEYWVQ